MEEKRGREKGGPKTWSTLRQSLSFYRDHIQGLERVKPRSQTELAQIGAMPKLVVRIRSALKRVLLSGFIIYPFVFFVRSRSCRSLV
jgi:hypothetical protein